jgi:hypothetical protein
MFSLADMRSKDMLTVMISRPMYSTTVAVHIETDILYSTLPCTNDLTRLINAHE